MRLFFYIFVRSQSYKEIKDINASWKVIPKENTYIVSIGEFILNAILLSYFYGMNSQMVGEENQKVNCSIQLDLNNSEYIGCAGESNFIGSNENQDHFYFEVNNKRQFESNKTEEEEEAHRSFGRVSRGSVDHTPATQIYKDD